MMQHAGSRSAGISIGKIRDDGRPRDRKFHSSYEAPCLPRAGVWRPCVRSYIATRFAHYVALFVQCWQGSTLATQVACLQCSSEASGATHWNVECATDGLDSDSVSQHVSPHGDTHEDGESACDVSVGHEYTRVDLWMGNGYQRLLAWKNL